MPFSICGTTVAEQNSTLLRRWLCSYHSLQTHAHEHLLSWNDLYEAHISPIWYGIFVLIRNVLITGRIVVSWCWCFDIFQRTRITLLESSKLMQLPFSYLRKPAPFELPRSAAHTRYLLYTDLLCFGWTMLNGNTSQRVFATYLHFLDNLETQLECLDFPVPKIKLPAAFGKGSNAKPEGRGWTVRA